MRTRLRAAACTALLLAASGVSASEPTGVWFGAQGERTAQTECAAASSAERFRKVLAEAGWKEDAEVPSIDWSRDRAVVIAPLQQYRNARLVFHGMSREQDRVFFRYGVETRPGAAGADVIPMLPGASPGDEPAIIVVAYPRSTERGLRYTCRNLGLDAAADPPSAATRPGGD